MADLRLFQTFSLSVSAAELTLILKALGGRAMDEDQAAQAKELGDRLSVQRVSLIEDAARNTAKLRRSLEEAGVPFKEKDDGR